VEGVQKEELVSLGTGTKERSGPEKGDTKKQQKATSAMKFDKGMRKARLYQRFPANVVSCFVSGRTISLNIRPMARVQSRSQCLASCKSFSALAK